jgi:hypothetical protein
MKKLLLVVVVAVAAYFGYVQQAPRPSDVRATSTDQSSTALVSAIENHTSHIQVEGQGRIIKVLPDDNDGSRHQRFLLRLSSGQLILIVHNIDIAPHLDSLDEDDIVEFSGEYIWNPKGGLIHWTHHDPAGQHRAGWLKHDGKLYS